MRVSPTSLPSGINNSQRYGRCQLITGAIANDADMAEQYRQRYFAIPACAVLNLQRDADLALGYDGGMHALSSGLGGEAPLAGVHDECIEAALGIAKVRFSEFAKQGGEPLLYGILWRDVVSSLFTKVATVIKKPVCLPEQLLY